MMVYILTEGGKGRGFGHITRCLSLIQAFNNKNIFPNLYIDGDDTITSFVSYQKTFFTNWLNNENKILTLFSPSDIVIIDSYNAQKEFYEKVSQTVKLGAYFDDYHRITYPKGIVISPGISNEIAVHKHQKSSVYLAGSQYIPLRQDFEEVPEKEIKAEIHTILVTFGGEDNKDMTTKVLQLLQKKFQINVIVGNGYKKKKHLQQLKNSTTKFFFSPSAEEIKELMLESDVAISAGGQTLFELIRVGIPVIAIATAENQINNIASLSKAEIILNASAHPKNAWDKTIEEKLAYLATEKNRKKHSVLGKKYIDGLGSKRIVEEILKKCDENIIPNK